MKRQSALALVIAVTIAPSAAAQTGTYDVVACDDVAGAANNSWVESNNSPAKLETGNGCGASGVYAGLYARDVVGVSNVSARGSAQWSFTAPGGTTITGVSYSRWLFKEDDDDWQPALRADGLSIDSCTIAGTAIDCTSGTQGGQRTSASFPGANLLSFGVLCVAVAPVTCSNGGTLHKAVAVLYGATVTLSDPSLPTLSNVGGSALAGGYLRSAQSVTYDASDNTGIRTGRLYVDGSVRASTTYACDFTYAVPCSDKSGAELSLDTRSLGDGPHTVQVAAGDPAGNEAKSAPWTVLVDNTAPASAQNLVVGGGTGWRRENSFSVSWANGTDAGSPPAVAHYKVCASDGSGCQPEQQAVGDNIARIDGISVPSEGEWELRVWLEDAAGNLDPANAARATLRYGNPPAAPAPTGSTSAPVPATASVTQAAPAPVPDLTTGLTTPPSSLFRRDLALRLTSARLSHGRLVVRGRLASGATARLVLTTRTASGRLARRSFLVETRFAVSFKLRRARGRVTARFAGDATFRPASASIHPTH